jgi:mannose-6-phosphate isomerase-like protein (cupin superfamily)
MFIHVEDVDWHEPPGHFGAYSRYLVNPDNLGSAYFDFRISRYPEGGRVEPHVHDVAEHVYLVTAGRGEARCGDELRSVGPGTVLFVPPGITHSIANTGADDLEFVVVTSPPSDIAR